MAASAGSKRMGRYTTGSGVRLLWSALADVRRDADDREPGRRGLRAAPSDPGAGVSVKPMRRPIGSSPGSASRRTAG